MPSWEPSESDREWQRNALAMLKDGGTWIAPNTGFYIINRKAKTLTRVVRVPASDEETYERIVLCCKMIGYKVIDKTGE